MGNPTPKADQLRAMREEKHADDPLAIPGFLKRKPGERLPPVTKRAARAAPPRPAPAPSVSDKTVVDIEAQERERQRLKRAGAKARREALKSGAASQMPLSGRAAAAAIRAERRKRPDNTTEEKPMKKAKSKKSPKKAVAKKTVKAKPVRTPKAAGGESKTDVVAKLLQRANGCTTADVLAATKWPAVSMPQMAKAAGLTLRKEKNKGELTRYWGTPQAAE